MKLKFRADKKDFVAFAWACLLLLVIVSSRLGTQAIIFGLYFIIVSSNVL